MKVKLTIELELPEGTVVPTTEQQSLEFSDVLYDAYVHYVTSQHLMDAVKWCAKGKVGSDNEEPRAKRIYEYHDMWGKICSQAKWGWEIIE